MIVDSNRVVSKVHDGVRHTPVTEGPVDYQQVEHWVRAADAHTDFVEKMMPSKDGIGPTPIYMITEIECNGSTIEIETCCGPHEPLLDCAQRHAEEVRRAEKDCDD